VNGQEMVIAGVADGRSLQVIGSGATELKRQFSQGTRPLILLSY